MMPAEVGNKSYIMRVEWTTSKRQIKVSISQTLARQFRTASHQPRALRALPIRVAGGILVISPKDDSSGQYSACRMIVGRVNVTGIFSRWGWNAAFIGATQSV